MKKLYILLSFLFLFNCENDNTINNCNFLLDVGVNVTLNLNLPSFNPLRFTGNVAFVPNQGNFGIYVINTGSGYRAWDAGDPNVAPSSCTFLERDGVEVMSTCDDVNKYNLFTGLAVDEQLPCPLLEYRVTQSGDNLTITN